MFASLQILKDNKYTPECILDIGAYRGFWTKEMKKIYPNSHYFLFEAIDYPELTDNPKENIFSFKNIILNDKEEEVDWYQLENTGDSMYKENTIIYEDVQPIKRKTTSLDLLLTKNNFLSLYKNIFVKIDCQGAEINIIKGMESILHKIDFMLLEIPLFGKYNQNIPTFQEHIEYMNSIGFLAYDIVEKHYALLKDNEKCCTQVDMIFINKNHHFHVKSAEILDICK